MAAGHCPARALLYKSWHCPAPMFSCPHINLGSEEARARVRESIVHPLLSSPTRLFLIYQVTKTLTNPGKRVCVCAYGKSSAPVTRERPICAAAFSEYTRERGIKRKREKKGAWQTLQMFFPSLPGGRGNWQNISSRRLECVVTYRS